MLVVFSHDFLISAGCQNSEQRQRKNQSVDSSCQNQKSSRLSEQSHNDCRNGDKADYEPFLILHDKRMQRL